MKQGGEAVLQIARQYLLEKHAKDGDASEIVSTLAGKINVRFKAENSKPGSVFKTIDWKQIMTHFGSFQKLNSAALPHHRSQHDHMYSQPQSLALASGCSGKL